MIDGKRKGYNWHEYVGKFRTISSPINALLETVWSFSMDLRKSQSSLLASEELTARSDLKFIPFVSADPVKSKIAFARRKILETPAEQPCQPTNSPTNVSLNDWRQLSIQRLTLSFPPIRME
jgi:hypothetical protein